MAETTDPPDSDLAGVLFEREGLPALAEYTAIACLSPDFEPSWRERGELDRAARFLEDWCRSKAPTNASVEVVRLEGRTPLLIIEIAANSGAETKPSTLLYGHFDKQPPLGSWRDGLSPFAPVREGERLYGRGTADDGYAVFAALSAVNSLERRGIEHGRIVIVIEGSEESGSPDLEAYLDHLAPRLGTPALVICLDSGCVSYDRLWITTSLRGVVTGTLRVEVLTEGVHSGHAGGIVPSSFRLARELLDRIEDPHTGRMLLGALNSEVPPHRNAEISEVAANFSYAGAGLFPTVDDLRLTGDEAAERIVNGTWRASLEVIGQAGIPDLEEGGNVLRPSTSLKLSIRIPPNVDATTAAEAVAQALTREPPAGARVTFVPSHPAQGWDAPPLEPWLAEVIDAASLHHFGHLPGSLGLGGSIPFMAALGVRYPRAQFLATGVLGPESNAHGPNEFLHVPTARAVTGCIAEVLAALK